MVKQTGLKSRIICGVISVAAVLTVPVVPQIVSENIKTVEYVTVEMSECQLTANSSGEICGENRSELYLTSPVYVQEVYVEIGETVNRGDVLFRVDSELTKAVLNQSYIQTKTGSDISGYSELLEKYGIDASKVLAQSRQSAEIRKIENIPELVYSPFSGVVTELNAAANQMCSSSAPLAAFEDTGSCYAKLSINERYAAEIYEGAYVELTAASSGGRTFGATVRKIYPDARKELRGSALETVINFEAEPDEAAQWFAEGLRSGCSVEAKVYLGEPYESITLPYGCIRQDDEGEYVYLIESGQAAMCRIETVREFAYCAEVRGDISAGDRVIYKPDEIADGAKIYRTAKAAPAEDEL